jgi:Leucine-rich repeat (LRR) protein
MSNMSGTVSTAVRSKAGGSSGDGDNRDDDYFPAALPYAHWRAHGKKRKLSLHMIQFQELLAESTTYLRTLTSDYSLLHGERANNGFVEEIGGYRTCLKFRPAGAPARTVYIQSNSNELDPQWEHVANSITACPRSTFEEVVFDKIEFTETIMDMLGAALSTKQIDVLTLSYNNLDYMSLTSSYLENNPNVREVKVIGNFLQNDATALRFATAIGNNEHMKRLEMKECGLGKNRPTRRTLDVIQQCCGLGGNDSHAAGGNDILQTMLPHLNKLEYINFGYNDLTSQDVAHIASFIAGNPDMKMMNLGFSDFNDSDAILFVNALETNSTIERLTLNNTDMTKKAKDKINAVAKKRNLSNALVPASLPWLSHLSEASQRKAGSSAPEIINYEHWRSLGYDMESSQAFVAFQKKFDGIWDGSSHGEYVRKGNSAINIDSYLAHQNGYPLIAHHPQFVPLWRYFLEGLQKDSTLNINKVGIKRVQLVSNVVDLLGSAMSAKNVVHLSLSQNLLDRHGYYSLSQYLERAKSPLKILELEKNPIDDIACAERFSEAIIAHPSIEKLAVDDCGLGSNIPILSAIACTMNRVPVLSLCCNEIGNDGAAVLGNLLSTNPASLKTLRISDNEIDDDGVSPFAEALCTNTNLRELYLSRNDVTELGESVLREVVFDDTSLITLYNSNHTCKIHVSGNLSPETGKSRKITVKKKMSVAMFGSMKVPENTGTIPMNMHLFSDAPVELMPVELSFINKCSKFENKQPCLSNMYEVVRHWNVAVMFSYAAGAVAPKEKKRRRKQEPNTTSKKAQRV